VASAVRCASTLSLYAPAALVSAAAIRSRLAAIAATPRSAMARSLFALVPAKNPTRPRSAPNWAGSSAMRAAVLVHPWRFTISSSRALAAYGSR
jgi:hypothetical protein